jgi:aquaporin Z
MKVWQCDDSRPVPGLVPAEVETPEPQRGEVLIRVHAVGVTGTELLWQPTTHTRSGENRAGPSRPGHAAGPGNRRRELKDQHLRDWWRQGSDFYRAGWPKAVDSMFGALKEHWPEYLMEAAGLGLIMISACVVDALLECPLSPVRQTIRDPIGRTILRGLARGLTAAGLVYSPWGKQSGAHFNPAVSLTFCWLGKVRAWDACFYTLAQFLGGLAGVLLTAALLGQWVADPAVDYAVTVPGPAGQAVAFLAELLISFGLMLAVLVVSNTRRAASFTGLLAGALTAVYFVVERPYSGMSMNPARTFASAVPAQVWTGLWLYFAAPLLGMVLAGEVYLLGFGRIYCAKLHHDNDKRCIFHHQHAKGSAELLESASAQPGL